MRTLHSQRVSGREIDQQAKQRVLIVIKEQLAWLAFLGDLKTWQCVACQCDLLCYAERPAETANPVDPTNPCEWLHLSSICVRRYGER